MLLEQGERAALYERWPGLFTVAMGSRRYPRMSGYLCDLSNAVTHAYYQRKKERG